MSWLGGCYTSDTAIVVQPGGSLTIEAVIYASMAWISTHPAIDTGSIAPGVQFYYNTQHFPTRPDSEIIPSILSCTFFSSYFMFPYIPCKYSK